MTAHDYAAALGWFAILVWFVVFPIACVRAYRAAGFVERRK